MFVPQLLPTNCAWHAQAFGDFMRKAQDFSQNISIYS